MSRLDGKVAVITGATSAEEGNKALVLEAFDTLFNRRDSAATQRFWSPDCIRHSAHIEPGGVGLFELVRASPPREESISGLPMFGTAFPTLD
jgi:hypothetical protein